MNILVVDDSKATLEIVRRALDKFEYRRLEIKKVENPVEALALISDWRPDIILTDWHMPEMSGLTFLKEVSKKYTGIKMAMVTTVEDQRKVKQALEAGACFVIQKPFEDANLHTQLLQVVKEIEQSEIMPDINPQYTDEIALPKLSQLANILEKAIGPALQINRIRVQQYGTEKIPSIGAIYEDDLGKTRAVALLDIYAICVFAKSASTISDEELRNIVRTQNIEQPVVDACQATLSKAAFCFVDMRTRKNLKLKTVTLFKQPFDRLEGLFGSPAERRLDFACQIGKLAQGRVILVGF